MAVVPINSPPESYEEEFRDSEVSYPSEDDSMEDEPSESENTNGETEANGTKDEFWVRYPSLKTFLGNMVAEDLINVMLCVLGSWSYAATSLASLLMLSP